MNSLGWTPSPATHARVITGERLGNGISLGQREHALRVSPGDVMSSSKEIATSSGDSVSPLWLP